MLEVDIAQNEKEVDKAYELFYRSFGQTYYNAKETFDRSRKFDSTLVPENVFFIKNEFGSVIAAARTNTRDLVLFRKHFKIAGIATTAVHPQYRGKGLFTKLTDTILKEMATNRTNISMCLVFARRAIDNIYVKHGFWGTPVERKIVFLDPPVIKSKGIGTGYWFKEATDSDIQFLANTYRAVYSKLSVFLERPEELWRLKLADSGINGRFLCYLVFSYNLKSKSVPVGYAVIENQKLIETAACYNDPDVYKSIFFSPTRLSIPQGISLPMDHPALKELRGFSHSIYTRHPNDGGNVIKIINPYKTNSKIMNLVYDRLDLKEVGFQTPPNEIPKSLYERIITAALFGYELPESRTLLRINKNSLWDALKPDDFIFSGLDDF